MWHGSGTKPVRAVAENGHLHVPDASANSAGSSGHLSDLRNGARAEGCSGRGGGEPGAEGHDAAVLDRCRVGAARLRAGDVASRSIIDARVERAVESLDAIHSFHAGRALGWVAVFRSWRSLAPLWPL